MDQSPGDRGTDAFALAAALHADLLESHSTIAVAESLTGGELSALLSAPPGASDTFVGGVVSYGTEVKMSVLGVSAATVADHGVVSAVCAEQMAAGVRALTGSMYGLSTTGVAGPSSQEGKPVGRVYVALAGPDGTQTRELDLTGDRTEIRHQSVREALLLVLGSVAGRG